MPTLCSCTKNIHCKCSGTSTDQNILLVTARRRLLPARSQQQLQPGAGTEEGRHI